MQASKYLSLLLTILSGLSTSFFLPVGCSSAMKRLYEELFSDYNRLILPVANNKTKVTVNLGLKLGQILDLNLKQQILSTNVWVEQTWHDYKLEWDPQLYEGIDMIHVPAENIWIPDIVLFNNADGNYELTLVAKATVYANGTVVWKPPTMFRSTCEIDVEYFPFDIQTCFLRFGSWTYAGDELELKHVGQRRKVEIGVDLSQFYKNVEWDIIDVPAYYNEVYYECCSEPFPDITFKIVIRRKMLFYLVNLILPVALMTFMTVSVFYLPSDSNEKVTLSISILTSLIVFFLLMLEIIPASSLAVPLFGKYLLFTLALVSLSACVSVYVLNIHHRSPSVHSMSPRIRQIFLKTLPRILRLNRPDPRERSSLNRFRKKKIAQQMLKASSMNKVYDLAQPLAASLNLIETLHKSYEFDPKEDTQQKKTSKKAAEDLTEEGRYFRRYVDNYIEQLKKSRASGGCCEHNKCCSRADQPLVSNYCSPAANVARWTTATDTLACACGQPASGNRRGTGMLNDDTLDMTFDYDDQQDNQQQQRPTLAEDSLPSPPPPPRPLVQQLSDSRSGRLSGCSGKNLVSTDEDEDDDEDDDDVGLSYEAELAPGLKEDEQHSQLVDKLINSINMINNASDEIDTTNETSNNDDDPPGADQGGPPMRQRAEPSNGCSCNLSGGHMSSKNNANVGQAASQSCMRQPSDLLLSLRLCYDQMPAHVRSAIRSILFIADTIKNEDDENGAIEDWESMSMVVDRLFLWLFFLLCTFGSVIILALAPSLYDQRASIDDKLRIDIPPSNCSAGLLASH